MTNQKLIKGYGFDSYNQTIWEEAAQALRASDGGDTKPKVIVVTTKDEAENIDRKKIL